MKHFFSRCVVIDCVKDWWVKLATFKVLRVRAFGKNPNPDFESINGFSVPLGKSKKRISNPLNPLARFIPNPDFLDLKSKRSIGNGFEKRTHGQRV